MFQTKLCIYYSIPKIRLSIVTLHWKNCIFNIFVPENYMLWQCTWVLLDIIKEERVKKIVESSNADVLFFCNICFIQREYLIQNSYLLNSMHLYNMPFGILCTGNRNNMTTKWYIEVSYCSHSFLRLYTYWT